MIYVSIFVIIVVLCVLITCQFKNSERLTALEQASKVKKPRAQRKPRSDKGTKVSGPVDTSVKLLGPVGEPVSGVKTYAPKGGKTIPPLIQLTGGNQADEL